MSWPIRIAQLLLFLFVGVKLTYGQYSGGDSEGHANARVINAVCAITTLNPFSGGISDGHANARVINTVCAITTLNPFSGGISDGHANARVINTVCAITTLNPFSGGISDGHANARVVNTVCAITTLNPFSGGISDGHANVRVINTVCAITTLNPFSGGISDGHANARVVNTVCAITTLNPFSGGISDGHANARVVNSVCAITTSNPFAGGVSDGHANLRLVNVIPSLCIPTPIKLVSFSANCRGSSIELNWQTAVELDNDYFTVERRYDGEQSIVVGTVKGSNNSSVLKSYRFVDDNYSLNGSVDEIYYRLKQTDFNGAYEYSQEIKILNCRNTVSESVYLSPNPTNGILSLNYTGQADDVYSIQIVDVLGETIYFHEGFTGFIDLSYVSSGIYFVQVKADSVLFVEKLVIEK